MAGLSGMTQAPLLRLRIVYGDAFMIGPGKAELLQRIRDTGSISAAGRGMGMSYKRAWSLVEEMNAAFTTALVDSARGGAGGGGARLTETGEAVLAAYRRAEAAAIAASAADVAEISGRLRDMSGQK